MQRKSGIVGGLLALVLGVALAGCGQKPEAGAGKQAAPEPAKAAAPAGGMVPIPAGSFMRGDERGENDEKPAHEVKVSGFLMDVTEVTQKRYETLMGKNPSKYKGADKPVDQVSWFDAAQYCNRRSAKEGLSPCYDLDKGTCDFAANGYRLPTEAEWEYACRAGTTTRYYFGDDAKALGQHGWFKDNAGNTTHPVAKKTANPWGLYDMAGNLSEWCHDFYAEDYYAGKVGVDPVGPAAGETSVLRGGSWNTGADACRSSARNSETPRFADACFGADAIGFRCVRRQAAP